MLVRMREWYGTIKHGFGASVLPKKLFQPLLSLFYHHSFCLPGVHWMRDAKNKIKSGTNRVKERWRSLNRRNISMTESNIVYCRIKMYWQNLRWWESPWALTLTLTPFPEGCFFFPMIPWGRVTSFVLQHRQDTKFVEASLTIRTDR